MKINISKTEFKYIVKDLNYNDNFSYIEIQSK